MRQRTNWFSGWLSYAIFATLIAVGFALLFIHVKLPEQHWLAGWTEHLATVILIAGLFGLLERLLLRRELYDAVARLFHLHERVVDTGLVAVYRDSKQYDFSKAIRRSKICRVVVNDGRTWIATRFADFQHRFSQDVITELLLLDPDSPVLPVVAKKTRYSVESQREKIQKAKSMLIDAHAAAGRRGTLRIYHLRHFPTHSVFLFDDTVVITLYTASDKRGDVPLFIFGPLGRESSVFSDVCSDIENLKIEGVCAFDSGRRQPEVEKIIDQITSGQDGFATESTEPHRRP